MDNQTQTSAPNHDPNRDDQTRKRLFVLCDGTWQDGVNNQRRLTNVATFARCLEGVSGDRYLQIVYYDSGVGNATSIPARLVDGVTGRGTIMLALIMSTNIPSISVCMNLGLMLGRYIRQDQKCL